MLETLWFLVFCDIFELLTKTTIAHSFQFLCFDLRCLMTKRIVVGREYLLTTALPLKLSLLDWQLHSQPSSSTSSPASPWSPSPCPWDYLILKMCFRSLYKKPMSPFLPFIRLVTSFLWAFNICFSSDFISSLPLWDACSVNDGKGHTKILLRIYLSTILLSQDWGR